MWRGSTAKVSSQLLDATGSGFLAEEPFSAFDLLSEDEPFSAEPFSLREEPVLSEEEESEELESEDEELSAAAAFSRWRLRVP